MEISQPLISIVMPVYNVEEYLHEAVESVVRQTYPNWELILVDDQSTDSSGALCDEWAKRDERIRVIHRPRNGGLSAARNTGMADAKGEWIMFPDSDDVIAEHALETMLNHTGDVDVVICTLQEFPEQVTYRAFDSVKRYASLADTSADFGRLHGKHVFSSACTKLYRRERIQTIFNESVRHMEDLLFNLEFLPACRGICVLPDVLYFYRREQRVTLSKRFWTDTLSIRKQEVQAWLSLFPDNREIADIVLWRYTFYIMRWVCELVRIPHMDAAQKKMLLGLHLKDALSVRHVRQIRFKGMKGMLWRLIVAGNADWIYLLFDLCLRLNINVLR